MKTKQIKKSRLQGIREVKARLSEFIEQSKARPVIITNQVQPEAILFSVKGMDLEDVILFTSDEFQKALHYDKKKKIPIEKLMKK